MNHRLQPLEIAGANLLLDLLVSGRVTPTKNHLNQPKSPVFSSLLTSKIQPSHFPNPAVYRFRHRQHIVRIADGTSQHRLQIHQGAAGGGRWRYTRGTVSVAARILPGGKKRKGWSVCHVGMCFFEIKLID